MEVVCRRASLHGDIWTRATQCDATNFSGATRALQKYPPQKQKEWVINYGGRKRRRQGPLNYTILLGVIIFSSDDITRRRMFIARPDQNTLEVNRTLKVKKTVFNFIPHFNVKYNPATSKHTAKRQIHHFDRSTALLYLLIFFLLGSVRKKKTSLQVSTRLLHFHKTLI